MDHDLTTAPCCRSTKLMVEYVNADIGEIWAFVSHFVEPDDFSWEVMQIAWSGESRYSRRMHAISQMSAPVASPSRRPAGPDRETIPGCAPRPEALFQPSLGEFNR